MITISTNSNNDLTQDSAGNLALVYDQDAAMQTAQHFALTLTGEMIFALTDGVPFWPVTFGATTNIAQFEAFLTARLLQAPNILEVLDLYAQQVGDELLYTATLRTPWGTEEISNGVQLPS